MTTFRMMFTRALIRVAMRACVMGFCFDHLEQALRHERDWR